MKRVIVTLIFVFILAFATLSAQTTMYLKLPDIDGESQQQDHEDEIIVSGVSWEVSIPDAALSGRMRARTSFSGITISKDTDLATNAMLDCIAKNKKLGNVELTFASGASDGINEYLIFNLNNVRITSYKMEASEAAQKPKELWTLNFENISSVYKKFDDRGRLDEESEFEYSVLRGN